MNKKEIALILASMMIFTTFTCLTVCAEDPNSDDSKKECTLMAPNSKKTIYLIDEGGKEVFNWNVEGHFMAAYLLENGNLIHSRSSPLLVCMFGGVTGIIEIVNKNSKVIWEFEHASENSFIHHDFEVLPNGNILMIASEKKTKQEAINNGKNPNEINQFGLYPTKIIEVNQKKEIVWEWHAWDHMIQDFDSSKKNYVQVKNHPE